MGKEKRVGVLFSPPQYRIFFLFLQNYFEKLKKASEGWYIISQKNKSLYFNDLRFGLLNDNPQNPQFAFSYQFVSNDSGLHAIEVPKSKRDGKRLLQKIFTRLKGN